MIGIPEVPASEQVRIAVDLTEVLDRRAWDAGALEHREPLARRPRACDGFDDLDERGAIVQARVLVVEARIVRERAETECLAECEPVPTRDRAHGEAAVGAAYGLIGRRVLMRGTERAWDLAGREEETRFPDRQRHGALEQRDIDELTASGGVPRLQCGERGDRRVERAREIAD